MEPELYTYTSYQKYLKDFHALKKTRNKNYSFHVFAEKAGFKSKSSLANITSGRQCLSKSRIFTVARAMGLDNRETAYFEALVQFNRAKTTGEKEFYFQRMRSLIPRSSAARLEDYQYEYYSKWYHCAVREIVTFLDFKNDFALLANTVEPPITKAEARKSVDLLLKLNMIEKKPDGTYRQTVTSLSTGDEATPLALLAFHRAHLNLAAESLNRHDRSIRDISSVTCGVTRQEFHLLKNEIRQFRKRVIDIVGRNPSAETVYQVAIQLYPISKVPLSWRNNHA